MDKTKEVKITKLEIQLTDEKISLTTSDAKKLYDALAELFASKRVEHIYHDYWTYRPYVSYLGASQSLQGGLSQMQNCALSVDNSALQMAMS